MMDDLVTAGETSIPIHFSRNYRARILDMALCITQVRRHNPSNVTLKMCILKIETILCKFQLGVPFVAN